LPLSILELNKTSNMIFIIFKDFHMMNFFKIFFQMINFVQSFLPNNIESTIDKYFTIMFKHHFFFFLNKSIPSIFLINSFKLSFNRHANTWHKLAKYQIFEDEDSYTWFLSCRGKFFFRTTHESRFKSATRSQYPSIISNGKKFCRDLKNVTSAHLKSDFRNSAPFKSCKNAKNNN
jgi:hypothetical protein